MSKGIIYVMTTAVPGLLKIGKTGSDQYKNRMYFLENNGYQNVTVLKKAFAIEVEDYDGKETLLHEIFEKSRVGDTELFALDKSLVIKLLSSFEGTQIYPEKETKQDSFEKAEINAQEGLVPDSLYYHKAKDGDIIAAMSKTGDKYILKAKSVLAKDLSKISKGWASVAGTAKISANGVLQKDLKCSSPSMAAALIAGGSRNGLEFWKTEDGKTMKSFMDGK